MTRPKYPECPSDWPIPTLDEKPLGWDDQPGTVGFSILLRSLHIQEFFAVRSRQVSRPRLCTLALSAAVLSIWGSVVPCQPTLQASLELTEAWNSQKVTQGFRSLLQGAAGEGAYQELRELIRRRLQQCSEMAVMRPLVSVLTNPLQLPVVAAEVAALQQPRPLQANEILRRHLARYSVFRALDLPLLAGADVGLPEMEPALHAFKRTLLQASSATVQAFRAIDADEKAALLAHLPKQLAHLARHKTFSDHEEERGVPRVLLALAVSKVDFGELAAGMFRLSELSNPAFLHKLESALEEMRPVPRPAWLDPRLRGEFLLVEKTPAGLLLVGGKGPNHYGAPAAMIVDLGGDDLYLRGAGAPVFHQEGGAFSGPAAAVGVSIDLAGNDRYLTHQTIAQGAGVWGLGLSVDRAGNDVYAANKLGQGAAFLGHGVLLDMAGNDTYSFGELGQGAAMFGSALMLDLAGDDVYTGALFTQGFGGPLGLGELIDQGGDDSYRAGGTHDSSYGTADVYQAFSQGVGMGARNQFPGGVGVLRDLAGDDLYQAGNFAQGTGYFLGLGILADLQGRDRYLGSRYCQGAAAHLGAGALLDIADNDSYWGRIAANQGGAWDLSVSGLFDLSGADDYHGADLALGAAEQNAIGLFYDSTGVDTYQSGDKAFGFAGKRDYEGGRGTGNLALFLEEGGDQDRYSSSAARNNTLNKRGTIGLFLDR